MSIKQQSNSLLEQITHCQYFYHTIKLRVIFPEDIPLIEYEYKTVRRLVDIVKDMDQSIFTVSCLKMLDSILEFYAWIVGCLEDRNGIA